jgi:hypothetical protein
MRSCGTPLRLLPSDRSRTQENQSIARAAHQGRSPCPTVPCIRTRTSPLESEPCHSCPESSSPPPRSRQTIPGVPGPTNLRATPRRDRYRSVRGLRRACRSLVESPSSAPSWSFAAPTSSCRQSCYLVASSSCHCPIFINPDSDNSMLSPRRTARTSYHKSVRQGRGDPKSVRCNTGPECL